MRKSYFFFQRILDLFLALLLAIPALIIMTLCYIFIKIETNGPAFFVQDCPGYKMRLFGIYKLHSMIDETQRNGKPLSDMERMTKTGNVIRKLSLVVLPQILNILKEIYLSSAHVPCLYNT